VKRVHLLAEEEDNVRLLFHARRAQEKKEKKRLGPTQAWMGLKS